MKPRAAANEDADWSRYATYLRSRPDEAELSAIRLLLSLCREYDFRLHIVHLAASSALAELRAARAEGFRSRSKRVRTICISARKKLPTARRCASARLRFAAGKIAKSCGRGCETAIIDLVATDHSPCPPAMKQLDEGNFKTAWGGISSLSVALPVMWTEASQRGFTLPDIARWMAEAPARLAGCDARKGRIAAGFDADFVVFDPEAEFVVTRRTAVLPAPVSPYMGKAARRGESDVPAGAARFRDGQFPASQAGGKSCR